jgi:hypothetical protein
MHNSESNGYNRRQLQQNTVLRLHLKFAGLDAGSAIRVEGRETAIAILSVCRVEHQRDDEGSNEHCGVKGLRNRNTDSIDAGDNGVLE